MEKDKMSSEGDIDLYSTSSQPISMDSSQELPILPPEILLQIFSNLDDMSLLDCRSTCSLWNSVVLNHPGLMRKITFTVDKVKAFQRSSIVSKVKSIKIRNPNIRWTGNLKQLFSIVGIEKIAFDFYPKPDFDAKTAQIFTSMVSTTCPTLKELEIFSGFTGTGYLRGLSTDEVNVFGSNINYLSLDTEDLGPGCCDFLLSLPNLGCLKIFNGKEDIHGLGSLIRDTLYKHMQTFPGALKVVELVRDGGSSNNHYLSATEGYYEFLATARGFGVDVRVGYNVYACLNTLLFSIENGHHHQQPQITEEQCQLVSGGMLTCNPDDLPQDTSPLCHFKNLETVILDVELSLTQVLPAEKLSFLPNLQNLRKLVITTPSNTNSVMPGEVLHAALPSLQRLEIKGKVFSETDFALFPSAFPNLSGLVFYEQQGIPENLLCSLAELEKLELLWIIGESRPTIDSGWTDNVFTKAYEVECSNTKKRVVPAVASFRNLKRLVIVGAHRLTDVALTDGIALADSIEEVVLRFASGHFSPDALSALGQGRSLEIKDISEDNVQVSAKRVFL